jgi:DNA-binding beta-propeller fold protein YncE
LRFSNCKQDTPAHPAGTDAGQFYAPHGLAFDSRGHLYVVDAFNHRIQKFAVE